MVFGVDVPEAGFDPNNIEGCVEGAVVVLPKDTGGFVVAPPKRPPEVVPVVAGAPNRFDVGVPLPPA